MNYSFMSKNFYITTPIYYVNDKPHIGHAYTSLACDIMARFRRFMGDKVHFLSGTDEHGQKVAKAAQLKNISPKEFTDIVSQNFRDLPKIMDYTIDDFIRTTEPRHYKACQALWQKLLQNGWIYKGDYQGWYAVRDEAYYGEDELTIKDGKHIAPSGAECEWVVEESYFFKLSAFGEKLLAYYQANPDFIQPQSRRNEVISFVKGGLNDLSVSRTSFSWGVPVPNDDKHIMYVWLDALTNYMTALGFPDESSALYQQFWPASLHIVGKDIVRFHAVYWPAFLMAAQLPIPHKVFAHGWWTNEGQKISKSLGNVIDPLALVDQYGLDATRYFLMREVPFGADGDFSHHAMVNRINHDLANDLGNLAMRTLAFIAKNADGEMPKIHELNHEDQEILQKSANLIHIVELKLSAQEFHRALEEIWAVIGDANRYIDKVAPWALKKTDTARMASVLGVLCEVIKQVSLILQPFIPNACDKLLTQLAIPADKRTSEFYLTPIVAGTKFPAPFGVFPRIN